MIIIAHNVRSLHNVGAILRAAAALGVEKVFLTGYTGAPPRSEIAKVSLGAEDLVTWEKVDEIASVLCNVRQGGYRVLGLETGEGAAPIDTVPGGHIALVLGNEVDGIDDDARALLDGLVEIPMAKKRSLNVSIAAGIAMYLLR